MTRKMTITQMADQKYEVGETVTTEQIYLMHCEGLTGDVNR